MDEKAEYQTIVAPILALLEKKNADYGRSYDKLRAEHGQISFVIRLGDKYNRIKQLTSNDVKVKDESIQDTIKDIIGYCILELAYLEDKDANKTA
jgi:hypothetical protein